MRPRSRPRSPPPPSRSREPGRHRRRRRTMRPATRRTPVLLAAAAVLLVLAGCSSGGGDAGDSDAGGSSDLAAPGEAPAGREGVHRSAQDDLADAATSSESAPDDTGQKIIAKGNVWVESDDVGNAVFHVQRIADEYAGEITERETTTNDDGDIDPDVALGDDL